MTEKRTLHKLPKFVRDVSFRPAMLGGEDTSTNLKDMGKFHGNNGMIAYVDGNGEYHCVPMRFPTSRNRGGTTQDEFDHIVNTYGEGGSQITEALQASGYINEGIFVPNSNDGGEWGTRIFEEARVMDRIMRQYSMDTLYERLGIDPELEVPENVLEASKPAWEGFDSFDGCVQQMGKYDINNGVLAFYDTQAVPHVMVYDENAVQELEEAGFEKGAFVPHSNGPYVDSVGNTDPWIETMFPGELEKRVERDRTKGLEDARDRAGINPEY